MIRSIKLKQFKGLRDEEFELRPLTLLSGVNGMGKSSFCQAILLIAQNGGLNTSIKSSKGRMYTPKPDNRGVGPGMNRHNQFHYSYVENVDEAFQTENRFNLNDELVQLGLSGDVLYQYFSNKSIEIEFVVDGISLNDNQSEIPEIKLTYKFNAEKLDKDYLQLSSLTCEENAREFSEPNFNLVNNFFYISADRLGPQDFYQPSYEEVIINRTVGIRGEYTSQYLNSFGDEKIPYPQLCYPGTEEDVTIRQQVDHWMSMVRPGVKVETVSSSELNLYGLRYRFRNHTELSNQFRPRNVGFGISYLLPLFVSVLGAEKPSLFIIENPESHIHPKGQAEIGRFIALAASVGHQIIVETHSDHILNGIRVAVKEQILPHDKAQFLFFRQDVQDGLSCLTADEVTILANGKMVGRPKGFFDEYENQLSKLI